MDFKPDLSSIQEKLLTSNYFSAKIASARKGQRRSGGIAQLGERLNGIQEVSGSIPLISTKKVTGNIPFPVFLITFWELYDVVVLAVRE